jgi:hypothetical protein
MRRGCTPARPAPSVGQRLDDTTTTTQAPKSTAKKAPAAKASAKPEASEPEGIPTAELVEWIKFVAQRDRDWDRGGWDVIEDTWTDVQIAAQVQGASTKLGAQSKMGKVVNAIRAERKAAAAKAKAAK